MALLMEKGSEPQTESKRADLDAIAALKENTAIELKDKGNEYVKMGKKHFTDAIDCYTRAINQQALSDSDTALYRAAKAYFALNLLPESTLHCQNGLKHDPSNEELKKLLRQIESKKMEHEQREAQVSKAISEAKDLVSEIESRGLKIGKAMYQELKGLRKPCYGLLMDGQALLVLTIFYLVLGSLFCRLWFCSLGWRHNRLVGCSYQRPLHRPVRS